MIKSSNLLRPTHKKLTILALIIVSVLVYGQDTPPIGSQYAPCSFNNIDSFYVFGPDASRSDGRDDNMQVLFFRFPQTTTTQIQLFLFDPGISGKLDRSIEKKKIPTMTRFALYGGAGAYSDKLSQDAIPFGRHPGRLLESKVFNQEYPDEWVMLGKFDAPKGEAWEGFIYFKLVVEAYQGDLGNSFKVASDSGTGEIFGFNNTIRLNNIPGSTMPFIVEVPDQISEIYEKNYDMDAGNRPYFLTKDQRIKLRPARNGRWIRNEIYIGNSDSIRYFRYEIVRGSAIDENVGVAFTDKKGNPLKMFFTEKPVSDLEITPTTKVQLPPPI